MCNRSVQMKPARALVSIESSRNSVVGVDWVAFSLVWLAFHAISFDFWQDLATFIVSVIAAIGIVAIISIKWHSDNV